MVRSISERRPTRSFATEVAMHPIAQLAEARAHEREIGRLAPQSPRAQTAARALLDHAVSFLQHECAFSQDDIIKAFIGRPAHNRTGAVLPEDVPEAMEHGNLREHMALVDVATRTLSRALLDLGAKAAARPQDYRNSQVRIGTVVQKYQLNQQEYGGKRGYDSLVLDRESPLQTLPAMRNNRSFTAVNRNTGDTERRLVHDVRARHETGRKGINFDEHCGLPLSEREQRNLLAGHQVLSPNDAAEDFDDLLHMRLGLTEGGHGKVPNHDHPWIAAAAAQGLPLTAGISGHTYRFLSLFHDLGGSPAQLKDLRLACLAFLVPGHHSYHEVMASAAEYEACAYNPRTDTAEKMVKDLQTEVARPLTRASKRVAVMVAGREPPDTF